MRSNNFLKKAKEIAKRDKAVFDTLIEFEQTKKIRTKTRLNFTIDRSIASRFRKFCRDKGYNMSTKVEQAMRDIVEKENY